MRNQVRCVPGVFVAMVVAAFVLGLDSIAAPPAATQAEPTNADEAAAKKQAEEAAVNEKYAALVSGLSPAEQAWEKALAENLGSFYLPLHKRDRVAGRSNAWDFVKDDPALQPPVKDPGPGENTARFGVMLDVARLALQTDLTRIVTLYFVDTAKTPSQPNASFSHHELSHHGKDAGKIEKLAVLERDVLTEWGRFVGGLKEAPDGGGRLLDRTISVVGAGMGNASSHDSTNLPILVAGGRFKHGSHLAHDPKSPPPVCNLWVQVLHELGVEVPKFGSSTSETLAGFSA